MGLPKLATLMALASWGFPLVASEKTPPDSHRSQLISVQLDQSDFTPLQDLYRKIAKAILSTPSARFLLAPTGFQPTSIAVHYGLTLEDAEDISKHWMELGEAPSDPMPSIERGYQVTVLDPSEQQDSLFPYHASVFAESVPANQNWYNGFTVIHLNPTQLTHNILYRILAHEFSIRVSLYDTSVDQLDLNSEDLAEIRALGEIEFHLLVDSLPVLSPVLHLFRTYQLEAKLIEESPRELELEPTFMEQKFLEYQRTPISDVCFGLMTHVAKIFGFSSSEDGLTPQPLSVPYKKYIEHIQSVSRMPRPGLADICRSLTTNTPVAFTSSGPGPRIGGF